MPILLPALLLAASLAAADGNSAVATAAKQHVRDAVGAILQGQGTRARAILVSVPENDLDLKDRQLRRCALSHLSVAESPDTMSPEPASANPLVRDILAIYRAYWRASVLDERNRPLAEQTLVTELSRLLGGRPLKNISEAEPLVAARLKAAGLYSQEGRTGVLRDLIIWARDEQRVEQVPLPEGGNPTRVHYLDDFISRGWSNYFTCNRTGTGGWATARGLYVIVPSYDNLTDEHFRVSFLSHESQHFADMRRFGKLPSWRLEYRAKLVELVYSDNTKDSTLDAFANNQGDDPADGHSFANRRVLNRLTARLGLTSNDELHRVVLATLQKAAGDELKEDSARLQKLTKKDRAVSTES